MDLTKVGYRKRDAGKTLLTSLNQNNGNKSAKTSTVAIIDENLGPMEMSAFTGAISVLAGCLLLFRATQVTWKVVPWRVFAV